MKKLTRIINGIVAIALVGAICNIYITEYYCNLRQELADGAERHSHEHFHKHPDHESTIDGDHEHEAIEHHHGSAKTEKHSHSDKKEGGCCKTVTTAFYSALNKPGNVHFSFTKTLIAIHIPFRVISFKSWTELRSSDFFCYKSSPPKIPDIRIFIQSFRI